MASRDDAAEIPGPASDRRAGRTAAGLLRGARVDAAAHWLARIGVTRFDVIAALALTAFTAGLRLWRLDSIPLGLHGDEAWTGIDARRILGEGWIGVYVESALGQPAGPLYFTALLFTFLPESTFTIRLSMALFGIATIPLAYAAFSLMFNRTTGMFAALILSVMTWHLHLGRTGFMVITWPFMEIVVLLALWLAFRRREAWWFIAAGAVTGLGVYSYNAYLLFVPVAFVPLVWMALESRERFEARRSWYFVVAFAAMALLFALPLLQFAVEDWNVYQRHQRIVGVTHAAGWQEGSVLDRADIVWDRAREWQEGLVLGGRPDQGDGLAEYGLPPVEPFIYVMALAGLAISAFRIRRKEYAVCVAAAVILPWGALLTVHDGLFRRTLGLAPFIAVLAALPLAMLWDALAARRRNALGIAGMALVAAVPAYAGAQAIYDYFGPAQDTFTMRAVYPYELDAAARFIDYLPDGTYVYFYSDRWSLRYETVRFLAPGVDGEDRSREFRPPDSIPDGGAIRYDTDRDGRVAFVLLDDYLGDMERITQKVPGGAIVESKRGDEVLFRAYMLE